MQIHVWIKITEIITKIKVSWKKSRQTNSWQRAFGAACKACLRCFSGKISKFSSSKKIVKSHQSRNSVNIIHRRSIQITLGYSFKQRSATFPIHTKQNMINLQCLLAGPFGEGAPFVKSKEKCGAITTRWSNAITRPALVLNQADNLNGFTKSRHVPGWWSDL